MQTSSRDFRFDVLRFIALAAIILAHSGPPLFLFQLRNFDVPLMVLISGAVFNLTQRDRASSYAAYLKKRFYRLLQPTYTMYAVYFSLAVTASLLMGNGNPYPLKTIIQKLLFLPDYGTIIRIFLLIAVVAPFLFHLREKLKDTKFSLALLALYAFYELLLNVYHPSHNRWVVRFFEEYLFYLLPYACVFGFGQLLPSLSRKRIRGLALAFLFIFIVFFWAFNYELISSGARDFISTQISKSPPTIYYLSYAIFMSLSLFSIFHSWNKKDGPLSAFVVFVSQQSLWIYLWHVAILMAWEVFFSDWTAGFAARFLIYSGGALAITWAQSRLFPSKG